MALYSYEGQVLDENRNLVLRKVKMETRATSEKEARSNLMYRIKKEYNLFIGMRLILPGQIVER